MRWVSYSSNSGRHVGLLDQETVRAVDGVTDLVALLGDDGQTLRDAARAAHRHPAEVVELTDVHLHAPISRPPSIRDSLCFLDHLRGCRQAMGAPAELPAVWNSVPAFYFGNPASVVGPFDDVAISPGSSLFDFELEVGAVIGRGGRDLHPKLAEAHIIGYTLFNDWTARDLQAIDMELGIGMGKGKDSATTLGPWLVTPDELEPFRRDGRLSIELRAFVNDREITCGTLDQADWTFGEILSYVSRGVDLVPGDVIGSGTVPGGCLFEHTRIDTREDPASWLAVGDVVRLQGDGLGSTRQTVRAANPVHSLPDRAANPIYAVANRVEVHQ
ncbi:2-keto-4-pentenoate hydratase/2-oxohepta-3-ene-1,7-dioic acid hydratase in catechol pathway [Mycobacterium sp. MAA66]